MKALKFWIAVLAIVFSLQIGVVANVYGQWVDGIKPGDLVYTGGNVGIGTTNPGAKLHIAGGDVHMDGYGYNFVLTGSSDTLAFFRGGMPTDGIFVMKRFGTDHTILQINSPPVSSGAKEATLSLVRGDEPNLELVDYYNNGYQNQTQYGIRMIKRGTGQFRDFVFDYYDGSIPYIEVMRLTPAGNVGIGTDTPAEKLSVAGTIESTSGGIKFPDGTSMTSANSVPGGFLAAGDIDTNGEYQVDGVTALKTENNNTFIGKNAGYNTAGTGNVFLGYQAGFNETGSDRLYIDNSNTSVPLIYGEFDNDRVYVNGDLYITGNIYATSDARYKKDITSIPSSLDKILSIRGVSFAWKNEQHSGRTYSEGKHFGVLAQEVEEVLPEIVDTGKTGERTVAYMELIPVLIEAVKEQQKIYEDKFKNQQKTISVLIEKVIDLEKELKLNNKMAMADND